jgi:alkaline phosphatase
VAANSSWDETLVIITADHETGYLAGPGSDPNWNPMEGQAGQLPDVSWHSPNHTNALVPLFAKGVGSDLLEGRATNWDNVRGAFLDNTDIGKSLFDVLGYNYSGVEANVPLEAAVGLTAPAPGTLSMKVAPVAEPVEFAQAAGALRAALPTVTIRDTRNQVQAQGGGWAVSGQALDFTAGNRVIEAANLSWDPAVAASDSGASAGPRGRTLGQAATLAQADGDTRAGTTILGANLRLNVPAAAQSGRYGSEITLTLFAED